MPAWSAVVSARAARRTRESASPDGLCAICCRRRRWKASRAACATRRSAPLRSRPAAQPRYEGNPTWTSFVTGATFVARPEDGRGVTGIGNSGYQLDPRRFVSRRAAASAPASQIVHGRRAAGDARYLASSEFCGACHDVRLFGTDTIGGATRRALQATAQRVLGVGDVGRRRERRRARARRRCQDCHMSLYPRRVRAEAPAARRRARPRCGLPGGHRFRSQRRARRREEARAPSASSELRRIIDRTSSRASTSRSRARFPDAGRPTTTLDATACRSASATAATCSSATPSASRIGERVARRAAASRSRSRSRTSAPAIRVPAGFSQEREIWVELTVRDARGAVVYEVGNVSSDDADLHDKVFVRVTTARRRRSTPGRPLGVFGADVVDGPTCRRGPRRPSAACGGARHVSAARGLINFQNGFLRCVRCIGIIDRDGAASPAPGRGERAPIASTTARTISTPASAART